MSRALERGLFTVLVIGLQITPMLGVGQRGQVMMSTANTLRCRVARLAIAERSVDRLR